MEIYEWKKDVKLICQTATSFPDGIKDAFNTLQENTPNCEQRTWYGISSQNEDGVIIYKAAVNELEDSEAEKLNAESFTITTGTYLAEAVKDWMKDPQQIGEIFTRLLADPRLDYTFPCIEWYNKSDDVLCLVRILD
ncbi:hypothetical protein [Dyadobacter psychrotolerans]|uniref:Uncharacterized protein n=1 Tax=Dyadobacter psychrotolerans TaxID=2541721 RepID=A0A4R5DQX8_9BACT|nr:hypothetical protein [Dyadobacter psychrotolerans]TDE14610.1 hypothetical protein E0F88_15565 [Dyadobacter psychrotolerans]